MDDIPPVRPIEVVPQSAYVTRQSWALWEGLMALVSGLGESHVIYLGGVIMLSHQKPVPVNLHIFSMCLLAMSCHRDRRHLHSAVWALYFLLGRSIWVATSPILHCMNASSNIPDMIASGWHVMVFAFLTFSDISIRQNSPIRTFSATCSHSGYHDPRSP